MIKDNLFKLKQLPKRLYRNSIWKGMSKAIASEEDEYAVCHKAPNLTPAERAEIRTVWQGVCPNLDVGVSGFKDFKLLYGFSAEYVPFGYFFPWMVRVLNPIDSARVFANKGLTYTIFADIPQPKLVARKINGCLFNDAGDQVEEMDVVQMIQNMHSDVIVKQSLGSCCGHGVTNISASESSEIILKTLQNFQSDYVIQHRLIQSEVTDRFNKSSLNTFRISTLLLNGRFSMCTAMLRFGVPGNIVDNVGAGGGCVGINDDGSLMPFGFAKSGEKIYEWNGIRFAGLSIPNFENVIKTALKAHTHIPLCAFVGWDLALDANGEVNLIEANLEWPGLFFEQLANGRPAFRDRFVEVLDFVCTHPLPLLPMYFATN